MYLALEQQLSLFRELVKDEPLNAQIVGKNILIHTTVHENPLTIS